MALIVQKYGGTSVADPDRIKAVAEHVAFTKRHGNDVVVVVSAMGKATDNLVALANSVSSTQPGRELDMLLTTGERVSAREVLAAVPEVPAIAKVQERLGAKSDGQRAGAVELALEALYLAKRIDKVTAEGETVYG